MIEAAKAKGVANEQTMWMSIGAIDEMLGKMKEAHPELYWAFIHEQHKALYKGHYDEEFATYELSRVYYINKAGEKTNVPYWTVDQVEEATKGFNYPSGTTKWDKWVAFNIMRSDLCKDMEDADILKAAYAFFFKDEDWGNSTTKIWDYMCCKHKK